jgi:excisionase family DNA binding protein
MDQLASEVDVQSVEVRRGDQGTWWTDSMCRQHPTQWWFAGGQRETMLAKGICSGCAVRTSCLEFALDRPELLGVWAATTPNERAAMRRAARGVPVAVVDDDADLDADLDRVLQTEPAPERAPALALAPEPAADAEPDREPEPEPETDRMPGRGPRRGGGRGDRPELLTPAEAAHMLGVTPNTVTRWSRAGKVSAIQTMGGHRRFRRSEVERVLREANLRG